MNRDSPLAPPIAETGVLSEFRSARCYRFTTQPRQPMSQAIGFHPEAIFPVAGDRVQRPMIFVRPRLFSEVLEARACPQGSVVPLLSGMPRRSSSPGSTRQDANSVWHRETHKNPSTPSRFALWTDSGSSHKATIREGRGQG